VIILDKLSIRFVMQEDGSLQIGFPNPDVIETEDGPMMGFACSPQAAISIGASIIHEAINIMESGEDEEENAAR